MSGRKGFGIVIALLLTIAWVFLSIGNVNSMSDEQFEKEYKKTLIAEMDYPLGEKVISRIKRKNQDTPLWEYLDNPYIMSDIHRDRFTIMFSYREELSKVLKIKKIEVDCKEVEFIQDDGVIESDKTRSFVVADLVGRIADDGDMLITIIYEDNKLGITRRDIIIEDKDIDTVIKSIVDIYKEFKESEIQL